MKKGKYAKWLTVEGLNRLAGWARDGLTDEQIAKEMEVSRSTLAIWKNKYPEISDTLKKGKEIIDNEVEVSLLQRALGYTATVKKAVKVKSAKYNEAGHKISEEEHIEYAIEEIHIPADTVAVIFWLRNRRPDKWRNKPEDEANTGSEIKIVDDI